MFNFATVSSLITSRTGICHGMFEIVPQFYGRYGDLIKHYEVSLSQMLHDILGHDHIQ